MGLWNAETGVNMSLKEILFNSRSSTRYLRFLKNFNFYDRRTYSKFAFLVQLWVQCTPWRSEKSKKVNIFKEKIWPLGYPNMQTARPAPAKGNPFFCMFVSSAVTWLHHWWWRHFFFLLITKPNSLIHSTFPPQSLRISAPF